MHPLPHFKNSIPPQTQTRFTYQKYRIYITTTPHTISRTMVRQLKSIPKPHKNISEKYLNKLLLYQITSIDQIITNSGKYLMDEKEFVTEYNSITPLIKRALKIATQLFCQTQCTDQCYHPCNNHSTTNKLLH